MAETRHLGKYEILEEIGRGGFGVVYKARDTVLNRIVAVKVLHPNLVNDPGFVSRFRNEAHLAAQLDHPNLVPIYDFGESDGFYYIVMAHMPGGSLKNMLQKDGSLPIEKALTILRQIAAGLSYAHRKGIIHRDLKPGNILFDEKGVARASDLSFAKALHADSSVSLSMSGGMVGTPAYMAPEIWRGKPATPQADIYSLGCIFYEMLTGKALFEGKTPAELMTKHLLDGPVFNAQLPGSVRQVISKALATSPEDRYSSIEVFMADLFTHMEGTSHPPIENTPKSQPKSEMIFTDRTHKPEVSKTHQMPILPVKKRPLWWIPVLAITLLIITVWAIKAFINSNALPQLQASINKPAASAVETQPVSRKQQPEATDDQSKTNLSSTSGSVSPPTQEKNVATLGEAEFEIGTTRKVKVKELLNIEGVRMLGLSPDERYAAIGESQTVYIYQLSPLERIKTIHITDFIPDEPNGVTKVAFSSNQRYMAIRTVFDVAVFEQGSWNFLYRFGAGIGSEIEFVGDTNTLANLNLQDILFKNMANQEELGRINIVWTGRLSAVAYFTMSPDGKYIIGYTPEEDGFIKIVDYATRNEVANIHNLGWIRKVKVSKDSSMVMGLLSRGEVWVWNLADGEYVSRTGGYSNISTADFTPEGNLLIQFEDKTAIVQPLFETNATNYDMEGLQFNFDSIGLLELSTSRRLGWSEEDNRLRVFSLDEVIFWN